MEWYQHKYQSYYPKVNKNQRIQTKICMCHNRRLITALEGVALPPFNLLGGGAVPPPPLSNLFMVRGGGGQLFFFWGGEVYLGTFSRGQALRFSAPLMPGAGTTFTCCWQWQHCWQTVHVVALLAVTALLADCACGGIAVSDSTAGKLCMWWHYWQWQHCWQTVLNHHYTYICCLFFFIYFFQY